MSMKSSLQRVRVVPSLPRRAVDAHKGDFGRVLVIGGSAGMAGAPALVGMAALRSGAGLVTIAVPIEIQPVVAALCPCATTIGLPQTSAGQINPPAAHQMLKKRGVFKREPGGSAPDALVVGPGLGRGPARYGGAVWRLIDAFRIGAGVPTVADADALNLLPRAATDKAGGWEKRLHPRTVITPHPGELARMHAVSTGAVQADREAFAVRTALLMTRRRASADEAPVVVLKGAGTVVTDGTRAYTNRTGNPGMATGGSGDVLAGMIAALIGQGLSVFDAAIAGVYHHGLAGNLAARRLGQISLIATDIIEALPEAFQRNAQLRRK